MTNLYQFRSKDQLALSEAQAELRSALADKEFLSGKAIVDADRLMRVVLAQSKVTKLQKILRERKTNG